MDVQTAAIFLAIFSILGLFFLGYVLSIQIPLLKVRDKPLYRKMRYILFFITTVLFMGTIILLYVDMLTLFFGLKRSTNTINPIGVLVVFTGALVMMLSALGYALMYGLIVKDNADAVRLKQKDALNDKKK